MFQLVRSKPADSIESVIAELQAAAASPSNLGVRSSSQAILTDSNQEEMYNMDEADSALMKALYAYRNYRYYNQQTSIQWSSSLPNPLKSSDWPGQPRSMSPYQQPQHRDCIKIGLATVRDTPFKDKDNAAANDTCRTVSCWSANHSKQEIIAHMRQNPRFMQLLAFYEAGKHVKLFHGVFNDRK